MTNQIETYAGPLPDGWSGGEPTTKFWRGKFMHLYRVRRACATCGTEIKMDVTKAALDGSKANAGLKLKNCPKCRAERKGGGVGSRGGTSRPVADTPFVEPAVTQDAAADETLQTKCKVMEDEMAGLYVQIKDLRKRLAKYELPDAMLATAFEQQAKMPWE